MPQHCLLLRDGSRRYHNPFPWFEARYSIQLSYGRVFKTNELGVGGDRRVAKPQPISIINGVILTGFTR